MNSQPKKKKSTFQKITLVVIIIMLIATFAGVIFGAIQSFL
jgi:flagellar basal body-associated protein FliL